jgi:hypothetical protein
MKMRRYGVVLASLAFAGLVPGLSAGQEASPNPSRLVLEYDAGLAGISLGEFKVIATFAGNAYDMRAQGEFSLLAGLIFKATGETASNGTLTGARPQPARFTLKYVGSKKSEERRIDFDGGAVSDVSIVPQKKRRDLRKVPITTEQLQGVLDPFTAALLSVRSDAPAGDVSVCHGTIPVFEGKQRFDITLAPKRSETLGNGTPKGLPRRAAVCQVRYRPISGYRPDHPGVQYMAKNEKVEVWLVPAPETDFYIPYRIVIPTTLGSGTVDLTDLKVKSGALKRAATP